VGRVAPSACSVRAFSRTPLLTLTIPRHPGRRVRAQCRCARTGAGCNSFRSRFRCRPYGRGGFVPRASHPAVTSDARLGRVRLAEQPVASLFQGTTATLAASCRTVTVGKEIPSLTPDSEPDMRLSTSSGSLPQEPLSSASSWGRLLLPRTWHMHPQSWTLRPVFDPR